MIGPLAVFRCDASRHIGGGHVMRCLALVEALAQAGWRTLVATRADTLDVVANARHTAHVVLTGQQDREAAQIKAAIGGKADLVVVDHYGRDAGFERACRGFASRILVIDDLADRTHECDLLLDATLGRSADNYCGLVPAGCRLLLSPAYALLRPQFAARRSEALERRARTQRARRILVSFGLGADADFVPDLVAALLDQDHALLFDIVAAQASPYRSLQKAWPDRVRRHSSVEDMAELMVEADFALGAGGSTSWERCCLGLPSAIIVTSDNQVRIAEGLAREGAALLLPRDVGSDINAAAEKIVDLCRDADRLKRMARAASLLCDGAGVSRIVGKAFLRDVNLAVTATNDH